MHNTLALLLLTLTIPCIFACETQQKKESSQSIDALSRQESDLFYWNDYEPSPVDNSTTPFIREDEWFEEAHPPSKDSSSDAKKV